jgi:fatty-acid peroxygenase
MVVGINRARAGEIPSVGFGDHTLGLVRDGYHFLSKQRAHVHSDVFATRLLLREAIYIAGPGAAALFYGTNLFRRQGVAPRRIRNTQLGKRRT